MRHSRPEPEPVPMPESVAWLMYAGLPQGRRWRRHLVAASPRARPACAPHWLRGPAPR